MTSEEKLQNVEDQYVLLERGKINTLSCPYCNGITPAGHAFCCDLMLRAMEAIVERFDMADNIKKADAILERVMEGDFVN